MPFTFNKSLDTTEIRQSLADNGFVHIRSVLPGENANRIYKALVENTRWNLVFNQNDKHFDLPPEQVAIMRASDLQKLQQAIFAQARHEFQYSYHNYPVFDAYRAGQDKGHVLHQFYEWLNGNEFLSFAREATGFDDISFADAQATRYSPGHFLSTHTDEMKDKHRRAAYIFNFTREWCEDWGGYLQLLDDDGNVRYGLMPAFNALNILTIPQRHNVSFVTPYANGVRLSVSGWLRYGEPD